MTKKKIVSARQRAIRKKLAPIFMRPGMWLAWAPINGAYVFMFGDSPTRLDKEPMYFEKRADAEIAAERKNLVINEDNSVSVTEAAKRHARNTSRNLNPVGTSSMSFDEFFGSYIDTALWSSNDNSTEQGGAPLDKNFGPGDIAPESMNFMRHEAKRFYDANWRDLSVRDNGQGGHDFWLTRNRRGAGFWDGDWPEPEAGRLTAASKAFGEVDLYVGDDGKIYQSGSEGWKSNPIEGALLPVAGVVALGLFVGWVASNMWGTKKVLDTTAPNVSPKPETPKPETPKPDLKLEDKYFVYCYWANDGVSVPRKPTTLEAAGSKPGTSTNYVESVEDYGIDTNGILTGAKIGPFKMSELDAALKGFCDITKPNIKMLVNADGSGKILSVESKP